MEKSVRISKDSDRFTMIRLKAMKIIKLSLLLTAFFVFPAAGQTKVSPFEKEIKPIQMDLLAKLTGNKSITVHEDVVTLTLGSTRTKLQSRTTDFSRSASAEFLFKQIRGQGLNAKRHKYTTTLEGENIYAIIPATVESDEYVVLGAHYDSVKDSPGANDNASGTTLVYGVAYKLAKLKNRSRNFIIVFFDQEERGLVGSRAFAKKLKDEGFNIHSVHTVDQMGWDEDGDRAIELELPTPDLENLYRQEAEKLSIPVHKTNVPSTDHTAFREIGFDAIGITEEYKNKDTTPHYHKPTDTYETIDFDYLVSTTRLVFNVMKRLAGN
ncbi:MAG: M28 family peptidase [Acidobacteria bacterium]|nr:M28 family peptidase [Acidobacteriota bacterium]